MCVYVYSVSLYLFRTVFQSVLIFCKVHILYDLNFAPKNFISIHKYDIYEITLRKYKFNWHMIHETDQAWKVTHRKYAINFLDHTCEWVNKKMSIYALFSGPWVYLQAISETLLHMGFPSPLKISWCFEFFWKYASDRVAPGLRHSSHRLYWLCFPKVLTHAVCVSMQTLHSVLLLLLFLFICYKY